MVIKGNTSMSMSKSGKIKLVGGVLLFKVMLKLTRRKSILSPRNFQTSMARHALLCRR
jgi:hypothetical protein